MKFTKTMLIAALCAVANFANAEETMNEKTDRVYEELFKAERTASPTDPELLETLQQYIFGEVFFVGNLDNKTRELITVSSLAALQTLPQLKAHINAALNVGNAPLEVREAIYACAPFIGYPRTLNAVGVFNEVAKTRGIELPLESAAGTERKRLDETASAKDAAKAFYVDYATRAGLDAKTRELLALVVATALGAKDEAERRIKTNLKIGNGKDVLTAAIVQAMPYIGASAAMKTIEEIKEVEK